MAFLSFTFLVGKEMHSAGNATAPKKHILYILYPTEAIFPFIFLTCCREATLKTCVHQTWGPFLPPKLVTKSALERESSAAPWCWWCFAVPCAASAGCACARSSKPTVGRVEGRRRGRSPGPGNCGHLTTGLATCQLPPRSAFLCQLLGPLFLFVKIPLRRFQHFRTWEQQFV